MRRIVILGTGTAVGKTWTAVALARALRAGAPDAAILASKPIESALEDPAASDASKLGRALEPNVARPEAAPLYGFTDPISPHLAARRRGVSIDIAEIQSWLSARETALRDTGTQSFSIVESAGGIFSPLGPNLTNFDLALALEPARWVLVAPDALGVLSELTGTLLACRARGRVPEFVVLSAARAIDASTGCNARELRLLGIANPIAELAVEQTTGLDRLVDALLAP